MCHLVLLDGSVLLMILMLLYFSLFCVKFLFSILSRAHLGYLHLVRTSLKCCCSVVSISSLEQIALALCTDVFITVYYVAIYSVDCPTAGTDPCVLASFINL